MGEYNAHYTTAWWLAAESEVAQLQIEEDMRTILGVGNRRMQQCGADAFARDGDDERGSDQSFLDAPERRRLVQRGAVDARSSGSNLTFPLFSWSRLERHDLVGKKRQRELLMPTYARHIEKLDAFCASTENLNKTHWANTRNHEKVLGRFRERSGNQGARNLWNGEQFDACERKFLSKLAEQHTDLLDIHPVGNDSWNLAVADPIAQDKLIPPMHLRSQRMGSAATVG